MARDEAQRVIDEDPACEKDTYYIMWHTLNEMVKGNKCDDYSVIS